MGADGHIRIYDKELCDKKLNELGLSLPAFWYAPDWTCNGKECYLVYWGDNIYSHFPDYDSEWDDEKHEEFKKFANEHAVVVYDQEVWT